MPYGHRVSLVLVLLGALAAAQEPPPLPKDQLPPGLFDDPIPVGLPNERTEIEMRSNARAAFDLGRKLFFDPVLSADRTVACASCHDPARGFATAEPLPHGIRGRRARRNAPTVLNRALGTLHSWDGKAPSLEAQMLLPIPNPDEMGLSLADAVARLEADASYAAAFRTVFESAATDDTLAQALASFVGRLRIGGSVIDRFRKGEATVLSAEERGGLWIFESKGQCWRCHSGPNFSDESFHNTGVGVKDGEPEAGRELVTKDLADRGRFKTPTLRGLDRTAPFFHDGSVASIEDIVAFYRRGGNPNPALDSLIKPIELTDEDARNLVHFLRALSR